MAYYLLGAIDIEDEAAYQRYRQGVAPLLAQDESIEVLAVDGAADMFEGDRPAGHMFVIRFANRDRATTFLNSPAYRDAARHRHAGAATRYLMGMEGVAVQT